MSKQGANRHPAKDPKKRAEPKDGEDGFTGNIYDQRKRLWDERDAPLAERKDKA